MKIRWIYFICLSLFMFQCAKQTTPTGGPADETPPKLEKSTPKHEQTNVKSSKIELQFDETIVLNNPREQIIITPSVGKKFETTFNKNKVYLDLKTDLKENTTYSINFREAIQDQNEKNPANVKIAFSTGSYIDSLSINGKVIDALTENRSPNYTVALAEASDTFNIFKNPASWLTLTNKKGAFTIENLKPGNYILYAFDDRSKNMIVDSKNEQYAFLAQPIVLTQNLDSLNLRVFKLDVNKLKLITARTTFAYYNVRFSKSLVNYSVTASDSSIKIYSSLEPDLTTVKLYNTITGLDSLQVRIHATDSLNTSVDTLLYMKFPKKDATKDKASVKQETVTVTESNSVLTTQANFNKPITTFNPDKVYIQLDSLNNIPFTEKDYVWENNLTKFSISKKVDLNVLFPPDTSATEKTTEKQPKDKPQQKASLVFSKGAFVSVENDTLPAANLPIVVTKLEATAIIETKIQTKEDFIVQLVNKLGKVIRESINQKEPIFENLPPDTYQLRMAIDLNKNGKWDAGDFKNRTEPEPIVYYRNPKGAKEISLKANWTLGPLLITY